MREAAQTDQLTARESEVARLVADGRSNLTIAESLGLSERTVESHVRSILGKLGARSRVDIANILRAPARTPDEPHAEHDNLPLQASSFLDRTREVEEIAALISAQRLVTITGAGGVGKTRTAMQVAARLRGAFPDGVWFIELAPLQRGDYIVPTVATTLGITLSADGDQLDHLARALRAKAALLIIDNCEHVVDAAAQVIAAILQRCPQVKVLATSRHRVAIAGEEAYRLPSMDTPNRDACARIAASEAILFPAIELFVARARAAYKGFDLTDENAPYVAEICCRLDGIPLAIELAASRAAALSPRQLRDRLDERFRVLTGGNRNALPRHRTLLALIEWSHELLEEPERVLFRRLSIFASGFTLEAAVAVAGDPDQTASDTLELLASLIDKSMVLTERYGDAIKYRMLESTRVYALEKLAAADESDATAVRHFTYLSKRFEHLAARERESGRAAELLAAVESDVADIRVALDRALARADALRGGTLLALLRIPWQSLGMGAEAITRYERFLEILPSDEMLLRAKLLSALARTCGHLALKAQSLAAATQAVACARATGDPPTLAEALQRFARASAMQGRVEDADRALAEAESIPGLPIAVRRDLLSPQALVYYARGDFASAVRALEQARDESSAFGDAAAGVRTAIVLAESLHAGGDSARAVALARELLPALERGSDARHLALVLVNLAGYLIAENDLSGASEVARRGINLRVESDPENVIILCALEHLALISALHGDLARAATLGGYVDAAFERVDSHREPTEVMIYDRLTALIDKGLEPSERATLIARGAALTPEAAIALAIGGA